MQMQLDHTSVQLGSNLFIDAFGTLQGNKKLHSLASLCMMICTFKEENLNTEMGAIVFKTKSSIIIGRRDHQCMFPQVCIFVVLKNSGIHLSL
jgi:hypothetical protein